uniref:Uncharacterized protein n=1 Tax=Chenopodium quinoa TaxID=63459 RepID=A0A803LQ36_CHEQI
MEAQVYSFKGDDSETASNNAIDMDRARDPMIAREIIDRYLRVPKEDKSKRALNLHDMFDKAMSLVPYFEPTPISSVMNPSENHAHHQMGYPKFEGSINEFPFYNFPQDYYHQVMPLNQNVYHDQVGAPRLDDHGASSTSSNMVMYNTDPIYYDQKPGIVDNGGAVSSYGADLPTSKGLPQLPNVSLPWHMFYK